MENARKVVKTISSMVCSRMILDTDTKEIKDYLIDYARYNGFYIYSKRELEELKK